jgi:ABC-type bacteriocin/lantibiotic exporter with double-glycine peptidase domain
MTHDELFELLKFRTFFSLGISDADIRQFILSNPPIEIQKDEILALEGAMIEKVILPLTTSIHLHSKMAQADAKMGEVLPGRIVDMSAILRENPFQFSAKAADDGLILSFSIEVFHQFLQKYPLLKTYLLGVTGSAELRRIAKDIESAACEKAFLMQLVCSLNKEDLTSQIWLQKQGNSSDFSFFVTKGDIQTFKTSNLSLKALWIVPQRTWMLWNEVIEERNCPLSLRSVSDCQILRISANQLKSLQTSFPEDFAKYTSHVNGGISTKSVEEEAETSEVQSIDELFKNTLKTSRHPLRSYPWVQQHDEMDCGPACMAMISKYHGRQISIQQWRSKMSTNREGTSLFDLASTGDSMGFVCHGLSIEDVEGIDRNLLPCIVLRQYHYMVLYKVTKNHVIVGDPGIGIRKVPKKEFYEGFVPVALFLKPTAAFLENPEASQKYRHYLHLFDGLWFEFTLALACSSLFVLISLFPPMLNQFIFDEVLGKRDIGLLWKVLFGGLAVAALDGFMTWARAYYTEYIISKVDFKAKSAFLKKTLSLPYHFFSVRHVGDFTRRMQELEKVRSFMTTSVFGLVLSLLSIVIYFAVILLYSVKIAFLVLALVPGFFLISILFSKKLGTLYSELFVCFSEQDGLLNDLIKGVGAIKSSGAELASRWRFEERLVKTIKNRFKFGLTGASLSAIIEGYLQFSKLTVLGYAAFLAMQGELSIGQVIALTMISTQVLTPFFTLATQWPELQEIKMVLNRLNDIFLNPSEGKKLNSSFKPERLRGEIEFRDVWFRYGGDSTDWTLRGVSFKIEAGQNVAVVGPSGSGKSTIAYLITRMYEPTKGQIFIDGRDYHEYDLDWLRAQLGLLLQESHLFNGSILENIAFSTPEPSESRVVDAATLAAADEFIRRKPGGYQYHLSHGGMGLSGGEKQRVALARTLYTQPSILILDEATSALDGLNEALLLENLKTRRKSGTVISIAHRYSTVAASDFILVLQAGTVVGFGSKDELRENNLLYQKLFALTPLHPRSWKEAA